MPRPLRFFPPGSVIHAVNRGNEKRNLFESAEEFDEFLELLAITKAKRPLRITAYCLMRNHWHLVVWAAVRGDVSAFFHLLTTTHAMRRRKRTGTVGLGHVYQDRFKARPILSEAHYYNTLRYVEQNPLRAGIVSSATLWRWSSLHERLGAHRALLDGGPAPLPEDWSSLVDQHLPDSILDEIRKDLQKH
jgi:putative transposase